MESAAMGKVVVAATVENLLDLYDVSKGTRRPEEVRRVEVAEAVVDTGATTLSLSRNLVQQLGLERYRTRRARTTGGVAEFAMYGMVRLTVGGRECRVEVAEL